MYLDTDDIASSPASNPHLDDLIATRVSRRSLLGGAAGLSVAALFGSSVLAERVAAAGPASSPPGSRPGQSLLGFTEVPVSDADDIVVPPGYVAQVLVPWGTALVGGVEWKPDASNTSAEQALQVGFNHDGMHYFPLHQGSRGNRNGLLVLNHEYTDANQIYTEAQGSTITADAAGLEKVAKALAAHGVTVVEVQQLNDGSWTHVVGSSFNRRITGTTPMNFSGPVGADHPMLQSNNPPVGTLNNCAHGYTPWGTYLACEENWNGYFGTNNLAWTPTELEKRYGVTPTGFGYNWHTADQRFDVNVNRNELNRFGWVVEIDPFNPGSTPVKRTALGRIKHEGATFTEARGHAVLYTGDDENGDYLYKYVSARPWRQARAQRRSPLDEGTLYAAVFDDEGAGTWLPLVHGVGPLTVANGWIDQADVLIRTRMAADALGATWLHRPEWVTVNERNKDVFLTLTNGTGNSGPVNSDRDPNPYGHIVRISEHQRDNTATSFAWDIYVIAGDPEYDASVPADQPLFGSPDGIWADADGRLWIQTDISNSSQNRSDRGYDNIKNNQMLVGDPDTGEIRRFLTGPRGCEITGVITTPDQRTMFVNVQHPGESTTFWNNQFGAPSTSMPTTVSSWPHFFGDTRPRPATVVIRKLDGGKIGS
jgi:secreted PhoX family phosphatase